VCFCDGEDSGGKLACRVDSCQEGDEAGIISCSKAIADSREALG
jgi:hypothetical protein